MSVKSELLQILEQNREVSLSGQEMAERLNVSRTAIWKAMNQLRKEGYQIQATSNRGYILLETSDVLSAEGILLSLQKELDIVVCKTIDSTNMEVKRRAIEGAKEGLVILTEEQTAGRGRQGRSFCSPSGTGIYMSLLLEPAMNVTDAVLITTAASVAVCRGIRKVTKLEPQIKWVNDIYLQDKKICGILTEAITNFETGEIEHVVLGIGINYKEPKGGFPEEVKDRAGALFNESLVPRNELAAAVLDSFFEIYNNLTSRTFMEDYRSWSNVIGKEVKYFEKEKWHYATAVEIDDDGGLIVANQEERRTLRTGEITLRTLQ